MPRTRLDRKLTKRLDAIIDLPLARFRTAIAHLATDELAALTARIDQLQVKHRWALGSHGIDRHRAPLELGLLERRRAVVQRQLDRGPVPVQLHFIEPAIEAREVAVLERDELAA